MKSFRQWISTLFVLVLLQSAMGGCSHTQQSQFYTLNPVQPGSAGSAAQNWSASTDSAAGTDVAVAKPPMTIAIMAVEIPDYLDRPQIVTGVQPMKFRSPSMKGGPGTCAMTSPGSLRKPCRVSCPATASLS